MEMFIDFMRKNLTCAFDRAKCIEYLNCNSAFFTYTDIRYALGMLDRWINVGMFRGQLTFHPLLLLLDDPMQQEDYDTNTMMTMTNNTNNTNKRLASCDDDDDDDEVSGREEQEEFAKKKKRQRF